MHVDPRASCVAFDQWRKQGLQAFLSGPVEAVRLEGAAIEQLEGHAFGFLADRGRQLEGDMACRCRYPPEHPDQYRRGGGHRRGQYEAPV
jgi:hypothetical protein